MCLVVVAWKTLPDVLLACAGNRDEFYDRPSEKLHWWNNEVLAGRDIKAGGTWMGVSRTGRFAVVTNYRDPDFTLEAKQSRGQLVTDFLEDREDIREFDRQLVKTADHYAGYSLLYSALDELHYFSNRERAVRVLDGGIYGLSNHLLDTPWPKLTKAKRLMAQANFDRLRSLAILRDHEIPSGKLPNTKTGWYRETQLAPIFVQTQAYGTRASSFINIKNTGEVEFFEHTFDNNGQTVTEQKFQFTKEEP